MFKNNCYLFIFCLIFQSCSFFNHTEEKQVKVDVINYLEKTYHMKFGVAKYKWACNEGNGCPDAHILTCYPVNNSKIKFRIDIFYGDSLEIQRNEYKNELLNYCAEQSLEKVIDSRFTLSEIEIDILAEYKQLDKYQINNINFEKIIEDYPNKLYTSISIYLVVKNEEKKKEYLGLVRDVLTSFGRLPIKDLTLEIYFYNENAYKGLSNEEIHEIFDSDDVLLKDSKNCKKEWDLQFENKDLKNLDSTLSNLEKFIHEIEYSKIN